MKKKKEEFYYKNLCSAMEYAYQAAQFLTETLKHFDKETIQEKLDAMHELEQKGDVKKHKMMKALSQAFITPIEREDLVSLSGYIDDITDAVEEVLLQIYMSNVTEYPRGCISYAGSALGEYQGTRGCHGGIERF